MSMLGAIWSKENETFGLDMLLSKFAYFISIKFVRLLASLELPTMCVRGIIETKNKVHKLIS